MLSAERKPTIRKHTHTYIQTERARERETKGRIAKAERRGLRVERGREERVRKRRDGRLGAGNSSM